MFECLSYYLTIQTCQSYNVKSCVTKESCFDNCLSFVMSPLWTQIGKIEFTTNNYKINIPTLKKINMQNYLR